MGLPTLYQIASDTFTPSDSNWTTLIGTWAYTTGVATASGGFDNIDYWKGSGAFPQNQYSKAIVSGLGSGNFCGVSLNCSGSNSYDYIHFTSTGQWQIRKNEVEQAGGTELSVSVGDSFVLLQQSGVLSAYHNGNLVGTYTDGSPYTGGTPGMSARIQNGTVTFSSWAGGQLTPLSSGASGWMNAQHDFVNKRGLRG